MRQTNFALALLAAAVLTACGGSDDNNSAAPAAKPKFATQVTFGDSLSDVGTYAVGSVAAAGGGKFTINGNNTAINAALHGKNWTELLAAQLALAAPCPALTGLEGSAAQGFAVPVVENLACTGYAMGGARVTNPIGPQNKALGSTIGALTHPVTRQITTHLTRNGGAFKPNSLVIVMAGGNDALILLGTLTAEATAAGAAEGAKVAGATFGKSLTTQLAAGATNPTTAATAIGTAFATESARPGSTTTTAIGAAVQAAATQPGNSAVAAPAVHLPMVGKAQAEATVAGGAAGAAAGAAYGAANGPALVPKMAAAAAELAALVRTQIVAKGATHVVLVNLPDLALTPSSKVQSASSQQLIAGMVSGFNIALRVGIDGLEDKVLYVDLATASQDQIANPAKYGISNATTPACGATVFGTSSLFCTGRSLINNNTGTYLFADDVHLAPFGQSLIAKQVAEAMVGKGWL